MANVVLAPAAAKQIDVLPLTIRTRVLAVQFHLSGDSLSIEKVGHRDGFYDESDT